MTQELIRDEREKRRKRNESEKKKERKIETEEING